MKGLVRKDLYCLKKSIKLFAAVTLGIIVISVLFVLSTKYGNIAKAIDSLDKSGDMSRENFFKVYQLAIWACLAVPMAFIANVTDCFKEDNRADFSKFLFTMPVKYSGIVGARYISCLIFAGVSFLGSVIAAFFISLATDTFGFAGLLSVLSFIAAVLIVYMGVVLFLIYVIGSNHTDLIQCLPFIAVAVIAYIIFSVKIMSIGDGQLNQIMESAILKKGKNFIESYGIFCLLAGLVFLGLSYLGSLAVMNRKKGRKI
ncbi:MAG: ABC-2 transporter permease [Lachnospiraceae bacterium]